MFKLFLFTFTTLFKYFIGFMTKKYSVSKQHTEDIYIYKKGSTSFLFYDGAGGVKEQWLLSVLVDMGCTVIGKQLLVL